jgi:hypothetical protein
MAKRIVLLFGVILVIAFASAIPAAASESCWYCAPTGHGGGSGCALGPMGQSNLQGCFCRTNTVTHQCQMSGCPCHCEGNPIDGYLCTCYCSAPIAKSFAPTAKNIKVEHDKWLAQFKAEEASGTLLPERPIIWHARSASCLQTGGAFLIGMMSAAAELRHPVKFNIGNPANDSALDKLDQGIPVE